MQEVSATALLSQIELKCTKAFVTDSLGHTARSAEYLNGERVKYQAEVSLIGSGVSA